MSEAAEMIQRAKEIHQRLLFPPNAVEDSGIDLKRKLIPLETPPTPPTENLKEVLEYLITGCRVVVTTLTPEPKVLKIKAILKAVSDFYHIPIPAIMSSSRRMIDVKPRHIVFYIASRHSGLSVSAISKRFNRDHTTVLHAVRKMNKRVQLDNDLDLEIRFIENRLMAGVYDDPPNLYQPPVAPKPKSDMAQPGETGLSGC